VKRRLSDESAGNNGSANGFKIPKRTRRCGKCSSCMMVDCGACKICQMNQDPSKQGSPFKYVCLNRRPCESPVNPDKVEANGGEEKETKNSEPRIRIQEPPQIRCGKCMNCTRTSPCGACYQCTRGRMGACANRLCSEQQKQHLLGILQAKQAKSPMETNGTSPLTSVLGHLRDDFLGSKKERGRQSAIERCNVCENCLRTERCGSCANCLKQASTCTRQRCKERIKACNERAKQKKQDQWQVGEGNLNGEKPSLLGKRSMVESWSTSPNGGPSKKLKNEDSVPPTSNGLTKMVNGLMSIEDQKRLRKEMAQRQLAAITNSNSQTHPPLTNGIPASPGSPSATPGSPQTPLVANPLLFSPPPPKVKAPKTKRCGECTGCQMLSGPGCGNCAFCKTSDLRSQNRCPAKACTNRILVQPRSSNPTTGSPTKDNSGGGEVKKKKGRCGECEGCKVEDCGNCDNCIKRKLGETMRSNQYCYNKRCDELEKEKEKKPKMKRNRCGTCAGCKMTDGCGKCSTCLKDYPHLCAARRCSEPIFTEVVERPRGESQSSASKGRRCQECDGCKADPCGQCNACQKTPDLCKERECTNRLVRGQKNLHGVAPIVQNHQESSIKKGHNPRRYKRCNECDGCKMEPCGYCQSCRHNKEYADQMLAPATCENIICEDPIDLFGTNHKVLGEDGTCPTKVIMGKLYDFRCYFCKILPRVGMANRSELYRHYSVMHYTAELKAEFGTKGKCPLCHKDQKQGSFVSHMGQVHDEVHKYLPERAKIPAKVQKGKGGRHSKRGTVFVRRRFTKFDFPDIPDGFKPKGEERAVVVPEKEPEVIEMDGFVIELEVDADEQLMVSREEPYKPPDYSGGARCIICMSVFSEITEAVSHIHKTHDIQGGAPHLMLDAERLLKAGYLALCHGDTKTSLTEKGSRPRRRRLHKMFRAKAATGTEKLIGTGLPLGTKPPSRRPSLEESSSSEDKAGQSREVTGTEEVPVS